MKRNSKKKEKVFVSFCQKIQFFGKNMVKRKFWQIYKLIWREESVGKEQLIVYLMICL